MLALAQASCAPRLPPLLQKYLLALNPALLRTLSTYPGDAEPGAAHDKRYVDWLKIVAKGGNGGNGCISFYQGASRGRHSTADGGSGGAGGNVVIRAVANMKSLAGVQQLYKAEAGLHGTKQRQHGRVGRDATVVVPVGTVVHRLRQPVDAFAAVATAVAADEQWEQQEEGEDAELPDWIRRWHRPFSGAACRSTFDSCSKSNAEAGAGGAAAGEAPGWGTDAANQQQQQQEYEMLADLVEDGHEVVVAQGGAGGRGNAGLKARAQHLTAGELQAGEPGEAARLLLELKLLADVGLVGLPNAGKSTLLRALTLATPRVADYAFTTLTPQLGVVPPPTPTDDPIVVADIPGLIEGAHQNRGLGHHFLRHIERTKAIAFVLDCEAGSGGRRGPKLWAQLELLQRELAAYSPRLAQLPALVLANKADTLGTPGRTLGTLRKRTTLLVVGLSAKKRATLEVKSSPLTADRYSPMMKRVARSSSEQLIWTSTLQPLCFRLAQLLFEAGARQQAPVWEDYTAVQQEPQTRILNKLRAGSEQVLTEQDPLLP